MKLFNFLCLLAISFLACNPIEYSKEELSKYSIAKQTKFKAEPFKIKIADSTVSATKWNIEWTEDGYIRYNLSDSNEVIRDSFYFDLITEDVVLFGCNNIVYQDSFSRAKICSAYFLKESIVIIGVPNPALIINYIYTKKVGSKLKFKKLEVDYSRIAGAFFSHNFVIADEPEFKNETVEARYIYLYNIDTVFHGKSPIVHQKKYEVLSTENDVNFNLFGNKSIIEFIKKNTPL